MAGEHLSREIAEQPEVLARLLNAGEPRIREIAAGLAKRWGDVAFMVIAARGTSDNAARYAQYLFGASNRLSVALATPSLFTLYESPPDLSRSFTVGISQSGASPDIVAPVKEARRQGAPTLAITNEPDSPLALAADFVLPLNAGSERSVAATKTYTAQLLAMAMLSASLARPEEADRRWRELSMVPRWVAETVGLAGQIGQQAERFRYLDRLVTSGRGYCYGTAFEAALKLKETCYLLAEPHASADFLHGPVAIIESGFPALLVAPTGAAFPDMVAFARPLGERGAELLVVSDSDEALGLARTPLRLPAGVPEWLAPIPAIVPCQLLALSLARVKGLDPDRPRGLSKVTLTY
ncbi:MAG: SIS domain-containing protein [Candidatus Riflebacteria bacterium]|nr:SIS domain-containing protein [Candidatus Riflebacteria bacterium]